MDSYEDSDSSYESGGYLLFYTKKGEKGTTYPLVEGQTTIGASEEVDIRIKLPDNKFLEPIHCIIDVNERGIATLINKSENKPARVNNSLIRTNKVLRNEDLIDIVGKQAQYFNENVTDQEIDTYISTVKHVSTPYRKSAISKKTTMMSPSLKTNAPTPVRVPKRKSESVASSPLRGSKKPTRLSLLQKAKTTSKLITSKALSTTAVTSKRRLSLGNPITKSTSIPTDQKRVSPIKNKILTRVSTSGVHSGKSPRRSILKDTPAKNANQKSDILKAVSFSASKKSLTRRSRGKIGSDESEELKLSSISSLEYSYSYIQSLNESHVTAESNKLSSRKSAQTHDNSTTFDISSKSRSSQGQSFTIRKSTRSTLEESSPSSLSSDSVFEDNMSPVSVSSGRRSSRSTIKIDKFVGYIMDVSVSETEEQSSPARGNQSGNSRSLNRTRSVGNNISEIERLEQDDNLLPSKLSTAKKLQTSLSRLSFKTQPLTTEPKCAFDQVSPHRTSSARKSHQNNSQNQTRRFSITSTPAIESKNLKLKELDEEKKFSPIKVTQNISVNLESFNNAADQSEMEKLGKSNSMLKGNLSPLNSERSPTKYKNTSPIRLSSARNKSATSLVNVSSKKSLPNKMQNRSVTIAAGTDGSKCIENASPTRRSSAKKSLQNKSPNQSRTSVDTDVSITDTDVEDINVVDASPDTSLETGKSLCNRSYNQSLRSTKTNSIIESNIIELYNEDLSSTSLSSARKSRQQQTSKQSMRPTMANSIIESNIIELDNEDLSSTRLSSARKSRQGTPKQSMRTTMANSIIESNIIDLDNEDLSSTRLSSARKSRQGTPKQSMRTTMANSSIGKNLEDISPTRRSLQSTSQNKSVRSIKNIAGKSLDINDSPENCFGLEDYDIVTESDTDETSSDLHNRTEKSSSLSRAYHESLLAGNFSDIEVIDLDNAPSTTSPLQNATKKSLDNKTFSVKKGNASRFTNDYTINGSLVDEDSERFLWTQVNTPESRWSTKGNKSRDSDQTSELLSNENRLNSITRSSQLNQVKTPSHQTRTTRSASVSTTTILDQNHSKRESKSLAESSLQEDFLSPIMPDVRQKYSEISVSQVSDNPTLGQPRRSSRRRKSTQEENFYYGYPRTTKSLNDSDGKSQINDCTGNDDSTLLVRSLISGEESRNTFDFVSKRNHRRSTGDAHGFSLNISLEGNMDDLDISTQSKSIKSIIESTTPKSQARGDNSKSLPYQPITEDITPVTPLANTRKESGFKTPLNTPHLFENIRKSVLKSRNRMQKSNTNNESDQENRNFVQKANKRPRESTSSTSRSNKKLKLTVGEDDTFESFYPPLFGSFRSEDAFEVLPPRDVSSGSPEYIVDLTTKPVLNDPKTRFSLQSTHTKTQPSRRSLQVTVFPSTDFGKTLSSEELSQIKSPGGKLNSSRHSLSNIHGAKQLYSTPHEEKSDKNIQNTPIDNFDGLQSTEKERKKLMRSSKQQKTPLNDLSDVAGLKKPMRTPKLQKEPLNDLSDVGGLKKLMRTPKQQKEPLNDLSDVSGLKKLMRTPREQKQPLNDLSDVAGLKKLMRTPKLQKGPLNDLSDVTGLKKLMRTPREQKQPLNDLSDVAGLKRLMGTPKHQKEPLNDLSDVRGLKKLMKTPKQQKDPLNVSDFEGVANIFNSSCFHRLSNASDIENNQDLFNNIFDRKPLKVYRGKSLSPVKNIDAYGHTRKSIGDQPFISPRVSDWVKEQASMQINLRNKKATDRQRSKKKARIEELKMESLVASPPRKTRRQMQSQSDAEELQCSTVSSTKRKFEITPDETEDTENTDNENLRLPTRKTYANENESETEVIESPKPLRSRRAIKGNAEVGDSRKPVKGRRIEAIKANIVSAEPSKEDEPKREVVESPKPTRSRRKVVKANADSPKPTGHSAKDESETEVIESPKPVRGRKKAIKVNADSPGLAVDASTTSSKLSKNRNAKSATEEMVLEQPLQTTRGKEKDIKDSAKALKTKTRTKSVKVQEEARVESPRVSSRLRNVKSTYIETDSPQPTLKNTMVTAHTQDSYTDEKVKATLADEIPESADKRTKLGKTVTFSTNVNYREVPTPISGKTKKTIHKEKTLDLGQIDPEDKPDTSRKNRKVAAKELIEDSESETLKATRQQKRKARVKGDEAIKQAEPSKSTRKTNKPSENSDTELNEEEVKQPEVVRGTRRNNKKASAPKTKEVATEELETEVDKEEIKQPETVRGTRRNRKASAPEIKEVATGKQATKKKSEVKNTRKNRKPSEDQDHVEVPEKQKNSRQKKNLTEVEEKVEDNKKTGKISRGKKKVEEEPERDSDESAGTKGRGKKISEKTDENKQSPAKSKKAKAELKTSRKGGLKRKSNVDDVAGVNEPINKTKKKKTDEIATTSPLRRSHRKRTPKDAK